MGRVLKKNPAKTYHVCERCGLEKEEGNFYSDLKKQKILVCKPCIRSAIDIFNPLSFKWILEKFDMPFLKDVWGSILERELEKGDKANFNGVFGTYLRIMKLHQYNQLTYADSDSLEDEDCFTLIRTSKTRAEQVKKEAELKEKFANGEIDEYEYKTFTTSDDTSFEKLNTVLDKQNKIKELTQTFTKDLTDEDMAYLLQKWGQLYSEEEWIWLEDFYLKMADSFEIESAGRDDTLKKICKTSLKMEQAIDQGDVDAFQKLSRVYDSLMKAGNFTEAQNKEVKTAQLDTIGQIVALVEKEGGFIPEWKEDEYPQDKVDMTLKDINAYTYNLIKNDMGLNQQIEDYIKKLEHELESRKETLDLSAGLVISGEEEDSLTYQDGDLEDETFYDDIERKIEEDEIFLFRGIEDENGS